MGRPARLERELAYSAGTAHRRTPRYLRTLALKSTLVVQFLPLILQVRRLSKVLERRGHARFQTSNYWQRRNQKLGFLNPCLLMCRFFLYSPANQIQLTGRFLGKAVKLSPISGVMCIGLRVVIIKDHNKRCLNRQDGQSFPKKNGSLLAADFSCIAPNLFTAPLKPGRELWKEAS